MIEGYYYLHDNGSLIYKPGTDAICDIRDSDLCIAAWPIDTSDRASAWSLLVEARSLDRTKKEEVDRLAKLWGCDDKDALIYAEYIGCVLGEDGNRKSAKDTDFVNLQESPCGFGETYLEAMADLCKQIGYAGGKLGWHARFRDLLLKGGK